MRLGVRGLRRVVPRIDLLASSSLVRARQTADIVAASYPKVERVEIPSLAPSAAPDEFVTWLAKQSGRDVVAAVGHEPSLSAIVTWLVADRTEPIIELKKGAACLVDFPGPVAAGRGLLRWALTPAQLRRSGS
jgi:phosphohistidine phosphatase